MYSHQYDRYRAAKMQDATEELIRMRQPRRCTGPHPDPRDDGKTVLQEASAERAEGERARPTPSPES